MVHVDLDSHDLTAAVHGRSAGTERDEFIAVDDHMLPYQVFDEFAAVHAVLGQPFVEPGARDIHAPAVTDTPRVEPLVWIWRR